MKPGASFFSFSKDFKKLIFINMKKYQKYLLVAGLAVVLVWGGISLATGNGLVLSPGGSDRDISLEPTGTGKVYVGGDSLVVATHTSAPGSAVVGQIYFDSTIGQFRGYDGTKWLDLGVLPPSVPTNGLISFWKLDETSGTRVDSHGSNDLTDNNTVGSAAGIINNGADFELSNSEYLNIADAAQGGLDLTGDFSVSGWIKIESDSENYRFIVSKTDFGVSPQKLSYTVSISDTNKLRLSNSSSGTSEISKQTTTSFLASEGFMHFVVTFDSSAGVAKFYKNGTYLTGEDGTGFSTGGVNNDVDFLMGSILNNGIPELFFDGIMDEVGVWNRVLTADEIVSLYNGGSGLTL